MRHAISNETLELIRLSKYTFKDVEQNDGNEVVRCISAVRPTKVNNVVVNCMLTDSG